MMPSILLQVKTKALTNFNTHKHTPEKGVEILRRKKREENR